MSQYPQGYQHQPQTNETQPAYSPEPIDLQQFEYQQNYQQAQEAPFQPPPLQQGGPQPIAHYTYVQHFFVYPHNEPDTLSKMAGAFSYVGFWFTALIVLPFLYRNRFVRFHALQSLFLFGGMTVINIVFLRIVYFWSHIVHGMHFGVLFFFLLLLALFLLNIIAGISWFVGMGGAIFGKYVKLPFIGDLAEKMAGGPATPDSQGVASTPYIGKHVK
jgi:uncharacterized membrane protein